MKHTTWYKVYAGSIEEVIVVHETERCVKLQGATSLIQKESVVGAQGEKRIYTKNLSYAQELCYNYLSKHALEAAKLFIFWNNRLKQFKKAHGLNGDLNEYQRRSIQNSRNISTSSQN